MAIASRLFGQWAREGAVVTWWARRLRVGERVISQTVGDNQKSRNGSIPRFAPFRKLRPNPWGRLLLFDWRIIFIYAPKDYFVAH